MEAITNKDNLKCKLRVNKVGVQYVIMICGRSEVITIKRKKFHVKSC